MLPEESRNSLVVLTQDPTVKANLSHRVERVHQRALELTRELATMHLARVEDVYSRLAAKGHVPADAAGWLAAARGISAQSTGRADRRHHRSYMPTPGSATSYWASWSGGAGS